MKLFVFHFMVSLLNGISTFIGYLMQSYPYRRTHSLEDKEVHTFPKGICSKWNIIARMEFQLTYFEAAV